MDADTHAVWHRHAFATAVRVCNEVLSKCFPATYRHAMRALPRRSLPAIAGLHPPHLRTPHGLCFILFPPLKSSPFVVPNIADTRNCEAVSEVIVV